MKKIIFIFIGAGILILGGIGLFFHFQPRFVWIVEDQYIEAWETALADSPFAGTHIVQQGETNLPRTWYGYSIGSDVIPHDSDENEIIVRVYRGLAGQRRYGEALLLAIDPWMVFRRFRSPALSRTIVENGPEGEGRMLLAGSDEAEISSWTAQLLQESPGVFSQDSSLWEQTTEHLFRSRQFQSGARTFSWPEIWPLLINEDEIVWVYAPLSRIRQQPLYETNALEADVFPGRPGWNQFGMQAEILWAAPYGSAKNREKLEAAETWLESAPLQTLLANTLGWIAAHPESPPFNPVSGNARIAWLTSSYLWTTKP